MSNTFADEVERLRETAAEVPRLLDDATQGVATYAAALSELVQNLDARRTALNEQAQRIGARAVPDVVTGSVPPEDATRARLIAAARRGPAHLAVGLGNAAMRPACQPGAATPFDTGSGMGDAARAATALLTLMHHDVEDVQPEELVADADPVRTAMLLAGIAVNLAGQVMAEDQDVADWIASVGAAWALDGD